MTVKELIEKLTYWNANSELTVAVDQALGAAPIIGYRVATMTDRDTDKQVELMILEVG